MELEQIIDLRQGRFSYALKVLNEIREIMVHFRELGQFNGLFGSLGPSQSTTPAPSDAKGGSSAGAASLSLSTAMSFSLSSNISTKKLEDEFFRYARMA